MEIRCTAEEYRQLMSACLRSMCVDCALCPICKYERNIYHLVTIVNPTKEEPKE